MVSFGNPLGRRRRRTPELPTTMERSADRPNIAASAGEGPSGSLDGNEVLAGQRNLEDFGQASPTVVPESYGTVTGTEIATTGDTSGSETAPTILTGEEGAGGGGTTYGDVNAPNSDGTGEIAPYQSLDDLFEEYARSAFDKTDTTEQERLMREEQDRLLGQGLMDARASMGEAGFGMSGAEASLENTARSDAARQLGLDIGDLRRQAEQDRRDAIEGAMGIDLAKMDAANRQAYIDAVIEAMKGLGVEDPGAGDDGGSGNPVDDLINSLPDGPVKDALRWAGDVNADGTININDLVAVRGLDQVTNAGRNPAEAVTATNVGDVHQPTGDEKKAAETVSSEGQVPQPSQDAGSDGGGHYYWGADGKLYKVRLATMSGDY